MNPFMQKTLAITNGSAPSNEKKKELSYLNGMIFQSTTIVT